jgi:hypothetical protein
VVSRGQVGGRGSQVEGTWTLLLGWAKRAVACTPSPFRSPLVQEQQPYIRHLLLLLERAGDTVIVRAYPSPHVARTQQPGVQSDNRLAHQIPEAAGRQATSGSVPESGDAQLSFSVGARVPSA